MVAGFWGDRLRQTTRQTFQNYFIGQLALVMIVTIVMTTAFLLLGVPFALVFGLGVGILAFFPLGKTLGVTISSTIVSLQSIWLGLRVAGVAIVLDQLIDYFVSPLLIGKFTSLNPIWVLLSLLIGAKLIGFLGLVLAVPIAGTIKALLDQPTVSEMPEPEIAVETVLSK
ncbi:MAG: AI-2E family transporter [Limnothrix sp. RL_2_0]|nr:AI-2E family transporter [Limnothrix sp. RL_2_0]